MLVRGTWLVAPVLLAACGFKHGELPVAGEDGSVIDIDAPVADARVDTPMGSTCFGSGLFIDCYDMGIEPTGQYHPIGTINTDDAGSCTRVVMQSGGLAFCLKTAETILIDTNVRWTGSRPIVLLATTTITVTSNGTIDVSAIARDAGAGAMNNACATAAGGANDTGNSSNAGAGGGGGGGFGTSGGPGGRSDYGGLGGSGGAGAALGSIRGGCPGGNGGSSADGLGGSGGIGGGAVYLIAGSSISIAGRVKANGGRGVGGSSKAGGGGAGSGGLIGFDSPALTITGSVFANGGGAGEGGNSGNRGEDGMESPAYNMAANGGDNTTDGGNGGDGSVAGGSGGGGNIANNGGGGGGGGAGRIKVYPPKAVSGMISPPAT